MAKKMSVQEMLAAARAEKAGGAPPPAPPAAEAASPEAAAPAAESAAGEKLAPAAPKSAPKPGGKLSVAEMLAAARANKSASASPPAEAAAAPKPATKPAAAKATPAKPAAETAGAAVAKDTASILASARSTAKPGPISKAELAAREKAEPAGKKKLVAPPMPAKPAYAKAPTAAVGTDRRSFMASLTGLLFGSSLAIGFTTLAITNLMWLLGLARFMFPNILIEPPTSFKVGFADTLAPGQVETKFIPQFGVWIVRYEYEGLPMVYALKSVCTHLGCTPNWLEAEQKFKCPCHGSGFYKDGINFEGPAPRPLERYAISVADDGQLLVDKSRVFHQEQGQWKDPASFVPV
jgi:cytochrome b6-f complex iron-sulfur subunit